MYSHCNPPLLILAPKLRKVASILPRHAADSTKKGPPQISTGLLRLQKKEDKSDSTLRYNILHANIYSAKKHCQRVRTAFARTCDVAIYHVPQRHLLIK
jgi:hypothetical protein